MRRGARDFIQKPWENARLLAIVRTQSSSAAPCAAAQRLEAENRLLRERGQGHAHRRVARHAARAADDRARRPLRRQRADHGRERHRQGHGGAARCTPSRRGPARPLAVRERRRPLRGRLRERAVRPREGRLHRRQGRPRGPLRAGRRRHAVPRRDRERAHEPAAQAAARAGDRRVRARRLVAHPQGRRAHPLRHQRRPAAPRWRPGASARTCSSASTPSRSACRRCASGARTSRRWPATSCASTPSATASSVAGFDAAALRRAGRARLAGQRARAGPRRGARRADGAGRPRSGPPTSALRSRRATVRRGSRR